VRINRSSCTRTHVTSHLPLSELTVPEGTYDCMLLRMNPVRALNDDALTNRSGNSAATQNTLGFSTPSTVRDSK
jgi:hypothetical protein